MLVFTSVFRALPLSLGRGISPAEITGLRLERLRMARRGRFSRRNACIGWGLILLMALFVLPGMRWVTAQEQRAGVAVKQSEFRAEFDSALKNGDWEQALALLRPIVARDPSDAGAIFFLGYALHMNGEYQEALIYHRKAANFSPLRPNALYNSACALSLLGHRVEALNELEAALKAGFRPNCTLRDDLDFEPLFEMQEFHRLELLAAQMCKGDIAETTSSRTDRKQANDETAPAGRSLVTKSSGGYLVAEDWVSECDEAGTSINYFNPTIHAWKRAWIDDHGGIIEFEGAFQDSVLRFTGVMFTPDGKKVMSKMTVTPLGSGAIEQIIENSADSGQTWETFFRGVYRRKIKIVASSEMED